MSFLPDDKKQLIENAGGLSRFLLTSPFFKSHGEVVCLTEDIPVITASMNSGTGAGGSSSSNSTSASGGTNSNSGSRSGSISVQEPKSKPSLSTLISEQNLSGPDALKFDEAQEKTSTRTYGEQLGSGLNSPAQSPRLTSPIGSPSVSKRPPGSSEGMKSPLKSLSAGQLDKKLRKLNPSSSTSSAASAIPPPKSSSGSAIIPPSKSSSGSKSKKGAKKKLTLLSDSRGSVSSGSKDTAATGRDVSSQLSTPDDVAYLGGLFDQPDHLIRDSVFSSSSSSQDSSKGGLSQERKSTGERERENGKTSSVETSGRPSLAGDAARKETVVSTGASKTAQLSSDKKESAKTTSSKKVLPQQQQTALPQQPKGKGKPGKGGSSQQRLASSSAGLVVRPKLVGVCVQTDPPLTTEKWVMTDPQAPVESFKERYELAMREKQDLKVCT